jgi:hypothetical protein
VAHHDEGLPAIELARSRRDLAHRNVHGGRYGGNGELRRLAYVEQHGASAASVLRPAFGELGRG